MYGNFYRRFAVYIGYLAVRWLSLSKPVGLLAVAVGARGLCQQANPEHAPCPCVHAFPYFGHKKE